MRFLFLASDFPPAFGGIQKLNHGLCRGLVGAGHEVEVLARAQPGDAAFDAASGVPTTRVRAGGKVSTALQLGRALGQRLRAAPAPEVVVATNWSPDGLGYVLASRRRPPMILMGYGREFLPERGRPVRALAQRSVLRAARGAVVISRYTAAQMAAAGMSADRIRIVPPGIDPKEFPTGPTPAPPGLPEGPLLLTVARLVRRKGADTVIEALPLITKTAPDIQYAVIGGGPERERLLALAERLGVSDHVHLLGAVSDEEKLGWLQQCRAMVMPSRDLPSEPPEGFGIVYLEANLCGKPVIGARTGGVEEAIEDGVNGLLVEPDRPDQLAEAALRLLTSPAEAEAMGERGRRRALEQFSWQVIAPRFADAARSLVMSDE